MKRLVWLILTMLAALPLAASAQARPDGPAGIVQRMRQTLADLNLTPEQLSKTDAILDKAQQGLTGLRGQLRDMDPQQRAAKLREVLGPLREKLEAELTPEQKTQFQSKLGEMRAGAIDRVRGALDG